ncbi:MAG: serine protease [Rhodospirillaceae bacterium]|nr:serine protease [Rhodospirillaceae bacterium]
MTFPKLAVVLAVSAACCIATIHDAAAETKQTKKSKRDVEKTVEPEVVMIQIPAGTKTRPIEVEKVVARIPAGTSIGTLGAGFFCAQYKSLSMGAGGVVKVDEVTYGDDLRRNLLALNYNVVGNPNALFKDKDAGKAELLIGALIKKININGCAAPTTLTRTGTAKGAVEVEWQIYDTLSRQVVLQKTTQGKSKVDVESEVELERAVVIAFADAATKLFADPALPQLVMLGEMGTSAPGASAQASAAPTVTPTLISRQPLSKRSFQEHATDIRGNVVTVFAGKGTGSGFFVSDRHIITNAHVVQGAQFVKLKLITGREILGEVMTSDEIRDVALIQSESAGFTGLPVREDDLAIGSQVFAVGSPKGESNEGTVSAGIVSSYRTTDGQRWIQSDVNVMPGNSGGPLLDDKGNIIGLTSWGRIDERAGTPTGLNFFIPITDAMVKLGLQFR